MKYTISYEYTNDTSFPYCAHTRIDGKFIVKAGGTIREAKEKLIEEIIAMKNLEKLPEQEEIEI